MAALHPTAICFLLFAAIAGSVHGADWSYSGATGPSSWSGNYPVCGRTRQSPINLQADIKAFKPNPQWSYYGQVPATMKIANNGHSIVVTATYAANSKPPQILLAYNQTYHLDNVHIHWGKVNSDGSEHAIQNKKHPMEIHAVHKRVVNGVTQGDILVVGVLLTVGLSHEKNLGIERFISSTNQVTNPDTSYNITPFKWSDLIPEVKYDFYTYEGSLTTPPCSEVVTWVVKRGLEKVSQSQLDILRTLRNDQGTSIAPNFRPLQPANGRKVTHVVL